MEITIEGASYFTLFGFLKISQTAISSWVVTILLCIAGILLGRNLKKRPSGTQVLVEKGVQMLRKMVVDTMGPHNEHWTPFIGVIFLSSICGSLIGLTGFLRSTTADLSCTLTWAVMVSVIIWYQNIKHLGLWKWLKGFTQPIVFMTPMNLLSEIAQPLAMALRHFGNVAGGGVITSIMYTALGTASAALLNAISQTIWIAILVILVGIAMILIGRRIHKLKVSLPGLVVVLTGVVGVLQFSGLQEQIPILQYGIPAVFSVYFDVFSGFVQALVFSLLTMVYIAGACPAPETETAPVNSKK